MLLFLGRIGYHVPTQLALSGVIDLPACATGEASVVLLIFLDAIGAAKRAETARI